MKLKYKILLIILVIAVIFFVGFYYFLSANGKAMATRELQSLTNREVSMDSFSVYFPLNFKIKNLNIKGLLKADSVYIVPVFITPGFKTIIIQSVSIRKPEFTYIRNQNAAKPDVSPPVVSSGSLPHGSLPQKPKSIQKKTSLIFKKINITDGTLNFIDQTSGEEELKITVKNVNFSLNNSYSFPDSFITNFKMNAKIPWKEGTEEGTANAEGWVDFVKKDIKAALKISNIDGVPLYRYYGNSINVGKKHIQKAKLNFSSDIQGVNNDVNVLCHFELSEIEYKDTSEKDQAQQIVSMLFNNYLNRSRFGFNFKFKTRMDNPEFGLDTIGAFLGYKNFPVRETNQTIKATVNPTETINPKQPETKDNPINATDNTTVSANPVAGSNSTVDSNLANTSNLTVSNQTSENPPPTSNTEQK